METWTLSSEFWLFENGFTTIYNGIRIMAYIDIARALLLHALTGRIRDTFSAKWSLLTAGLHLPAPGDQAPLTPLRWSGVDDMVMRLRLLPLWGLEKPLSDGEREPSSACPSATLLFSGSRGGRPPWPWRFRLSRLSTASSRLSSRPLASSSEDRSGLRWGPGPPFEPPSGELRAEDEEWRERWEFGIWPWHTSGVELQQNRNLC